MSYEINGTIKSVAETQEFTNFKKREFVIDTGGQYPQVIKLEMVQDKCQYLDSYKPGDKVSVKFDVRGREYEGKVFNNLQAFYITKTEQASTVTDNTGQIETVSVPTAEAVVAGFDGVDSDIPF